MTEEDIDAAGDGDVLVILDLRPDESLFEAGVVREVVNRIQKLRKKAALEPTDMVEVYFKSLDEDESTSQQILNSQEQYIRDVLGSYLLPPTMMPPHAVILAQESFHGISNLAFSITLARPALLFNSNAVLALYREDTKFANGLQTYLLSRDHHNLKSEFHLGNGKGQEGAKFSERAREEGVPVIHIPGHEKNSIHSWLASASASTKEQFEIIYPAKESASRESDKQHIDEIMGRLSTDFMGPSVQIGTNPSNSEVPLNHDLALPALGDLDLGVVASLPPDLFSEINDIYDGKLINLISKKKGKSVAQERVQGRKIST